MRMSPASRKPPLYKNSYVDHERPLRVEITGESGLSGQCSSKDHKSWHRGTKVGEDPPVPATRSGISTLAPVVDIRQRLAASDGIECQYSQPTYNRG
jgi:hypothetical protein